MTFRTHFARKFQYRPPGERRLAKVTVQRGLKASAVPAYEVKEQKNG